MMVRRVLIFQMLLLCAALSLAETDKKAISPPDMISGTPPAVRADTMQQEPQAETVTIYESKFFPGFRPCTSQDYRDHDFGPVACQNTTAARTLSSIQEEESGSGLAEADTVSQGNIFKLRFGRFTKDKDSGQ